MQRIDLNGMWTLRSPGLAHGAAVPADVPGGVHPALMAAGHIPDPGIGDNALTLKWIGETTWTFERPFTVDAAFLSHAVVDLVFDGLDTVADVCVNDRLVLQADDMYRRWSVDVKDSLHVGENRVRVTFKPAASDRARKARYGFGSAYSPECVTAGICRPVHLRAWSGARLCDLGCSQAHADDAATLYMGGLIEVAGDDFSGYGVEFSLDDPDGVRIWQDAQPMTGESGAFHGSVALANPQRWWPNDLGEQPLYTLTAILLDAAGVALDRVTRRVGLRTLTAERGADGGVRVWCNGRAVFLKGGVWIPPGLFPSHVTPEDYAYLVGSAAEIGMNAFRIWEGGTFENDAFWDACDAHGIIVTGLADMFTGETEEGESVGALVVPLHHACLPDSLLEAPDETNGLRVLRTPVSYPHPDTLEAQVPPSDRNLTGPAMQARVAGQDGAAGLISGLAARWPLPTTFRDWVWLSQIAQGVGVCEQIVSARADPRCSGVMWEPFASCWAIADGSSIDADGRWKALQYLAQAAFADVTLEGIERTPGEIDVRVGNVGDAKCRLRVTWRVMTMAGLMLDEGEVSCDCGAGSHPVVWTLELGAFIEQYTRANLVVWLAAYDAMGLMAARAPVLLVPPQTLMMEDPNVAVDIEDTLVLDGEEAFRVTVSSTSPAFWVWLDIPGEPAQFSDNFLCLEPDEPVDIYVSTVSRMTQHAFRHTLRVRSLYDIRRHVPG